MVRLLLIFVLLFTLLLLFELPSETKLDDELFNVNLAFLAAGALSDVKLFKLFVEPDFRPSELVTSVDKFELLDELLIELVVVVVVEALVSRLEPNAI